MKKKFFAGVLTLALVSGVLVANSVWAAAAKITQFSASTTSIKLGESVTLTWSSTGGKNAQLSPYPNDVSTNGTVTVTPSKTTTYQLIVRGSSGYDAEKVTVRVIQPFNAYFNATQYTIHPGESTTLTWGSDADFVEFTPDIGQTSHSGGAIVYPQQSTTYQMIARKKGDWISKTVRIEVVADSPTTPPTQATNPSPSGYFDVAASQILSGQGTTLSWHFDNVNSVKISPDIGTVPPSGGANIYPTRTTTYTLTAQSQNKTLTKSVTVNVSNLSISPSEVYFDTPTPVVSAGQPATLVWSVAPRLHVRFEPSIGQDGANGGGAIIPISHTTTFTLIATDGNSTITKTVTVVAQ